MLPHCAFAGLFWTEGTAAQEQLERTMYGRSEERAEAPWLCGIADQFVVVRLSYVVAEAVGDDADGCGLKSWCDCLLLGLHPGFL
jgi:hypothetical protein